MAKKRIEDDAVHLCPEELPEDFLAWVTRYVIAREAVLLYKHGNKRGHCYHCGEDVRAMSGQKFTQNTAVRCPNCRAEVRCIKEGSNNWKADYVDNVAYAVKGTDEKTVFIRQFHVNRDYTGRFDPLEKYLVETTRYAIRDDLTARWQLEGKDNYFMNCWRYAFENWERVVKPSLIYDGCYEFYAGNLDAAISGTRLQYTDWRGYIRYDRHANIIRALMNSAQYPVMEFLMKAGYTGISDAVFGGYASKETRNAIYWKRTTLKECFKFPLHLLKVKEPGEWSLDDVGRMNALWKNRQNGRITEKELLRLFADGVSLDEISFAVPYASIAQIQKYLAGNRARRLNYRDYIRECEQLHLDLKDRSVLFPPDLQAAHERTSAMISFEKNKADQKKFAEAVEKLERLAWEKNGLIIRPARQQEELRDEGKALHHCVGGYIKRMADGQTAIFFVRKASAPDTPFYTLEYKNGKVIQCRTDHNQPYDEDREVYDFVQTWLEKSVKNARHKEAI